MEIKLINVRFQTRKRLLLTIMKAFIFLLCTTVFGFTSKNSLAQQKVVIGEDQLIVVDEVFNIIKEQTDYRFIYPKELFKDSEKVQLKKGTIKISELLNLCLSHNNLKYELSLDNTIVIKEELVTVNPIPQGIDVTGVVSDQYGQPLPGATVTVKENETIGAQTDFDGNYTITVPNSQSILVYRYLGFVTKEVVVGSQTQINITLQEDAAELGEVVVTALGIKREKKALGYAVQSVESESLNKVESPEVSSKLIGKVAGVQINNSATIGGSSRIVIRGESSLSRFGSEALIVVDGVPINTGSATGQFVDFGNGLTDFNSNDIESINVLKGPAAAALYGSRAGNGVVLITTKSGSDKETFSVDVNSSLMFESILEYPTDYQHKYGLGRGSSRQSFTGRYTVNLDPYDETWSNFPYDPNRYVEWWFSPTSNGYRAGDYLIPDKGRVQRLPYISSGKNNWKEFFEVGTALYNNVSVSASSKRMNARFSYGNLDQQGFQPGTDLKRNNLSSNVTINMDKFKVNLALNYVNTASDNRPARHWGPRSISYTLSWMMPGVYMDQLERSYWQTGLEGQAQINWRSSQNNPYFIAHEVKHGQDKHRLFGNVNITYNPIEDLTLLVRHGDDFTNEKRDHIIPFGTAQGEKPAYTVEDYYVREANTDFLATYKREIKEDWDVDLSVGGNRRESRSESLSISAPELLVPGLYSINNSAVNVSASEYRSEQRVYSLYSFANIAYKDMVFLSVTGRNDWSSTLPVGNNSFFYPSATLSTILSEMVELPKAFNYAKLRVAYAQVGKDTGPYSLNPTFSNDGTYQGRVGFAVPSTLKNPSLKPEIATSWEAGLETKFFNGRLGLDVTYYTQDTKNQVIPITLPSSSSYDSRLVNAGSIKNSGIEVLLNGKPIEAKDFSWNVNVNFSANKNEVVELGAGLDQLQIGDFDERGVKLIAKEGGPLFGIYGFRQATVKDINSQYYGEKIYAANGTPVKDAFEYLGDANPDFLLGLRNEFTYKHFNFSFLFDIRSGGKIYSSTTSLMHRGGYTPLTVDWRDNGAGGDGVIRNGDGTYSPNTIVLSGDAIKNTWIGSWADITTNTLYDGSFVKLREMNLSYNFSPKTLSKLPFTKASISLVGRNLLTWDNVPNQDADVYHDGIPGYTGSYTYPTSRTYGMNVKLTF